MSNTSKPVLVVPPPPSEGLAGQEAEPLYSDLLAVEALLPDSLEFFVNKRNAYMQSMPADAANLLPGYVHLKPSVPGEPPTVGDLVISFAETICKVPEGKLQGQPFKLLDFQKRFIKDTLDGGGIRTAILSVGRKNGKTALAAIILLAHLVGPVSHRNSQLVSGAMSRDQAALVYSLAKKIALGSPWLSPLVRFLDSKKALLGVTRGTEFKALAADGGRAQGLSPVFALLDEVGQVKAERSEFVEAIVTSQGAHDNPLLMVISTLW